MKTLRWAPDVQERSRPRRCYNLGLLPKQNLCYQILSFSRLATRAYSVTLLVETRDAATRNGYQKQITSPRGAVRCHVMSRGGMAAMMSGHEQVAGWCCPEMKHVKHGTLRGNLKDDSHTSFYVAEIPACFNNVCFNDDHKGKRSMRWYRRSRSDTSIWVPEIRVVSARRARCKLVLYGTQPFYRAEVFEDCALQSRYLSDERWQSIDRLSFATDLTFQAWAQF